MPASVLNPSPSSPVPSDANTERSAVVLALFGPSVGPCVGDFSTTYNRANGRLYASTKAILFYSNLFGFERRLCLQLSDIELIESYRSTSIRISMVDCEDHVFRKFQNRDAVLSILHELQGRPAIAAVTMSSRSFPLRIDSRLVLDEGDSETESTLRPHLPSDVTTEVSLETVPNTAPVRPRSQSVPLIQVDSPMDRSSMSIKSPPPPRRVHSTISTAQTTAMVDFVHPPENSITTSHVHLDTAWIDAKKPYEEIALSPVTLPCSIDKFMDMFFANEAPYPIARFQREEIEDRDVQYSKWKRRKNEESSKEQPPIFDRTVSFIHPLKNALGPSHAKTSREQSFERFGMFGIRLQNTTTVEGIPAADCFRVTDRWIVERLTEKSVQMTVSFRIVFMKRTVFKPVIQKNIRQETKNWFKLYAKMINDKLVNEGDQDNLYPLGGEERGKQERDAVSNKTLSETVSGDHTNRGDSGVGFTSLEPILGLALIFAVCTLTIQVFFLRRLIFSLENQMGTLQSQNDELISTLKELVIQTTTKTNEH